MQFVIKAQSSDSELGITPECFVMELSQWHAARILEVQKRFKEFSDAELKLKSQWGQYIVLQWDTLGFASADFKVGNPIEIIEEVQRRGPAYGNGNPIWVPLFELAREQEVYLANLQVVVYFDRIYFEAVCEVYTIITESVQKTLEALVDGNHGTIMQAEILWEGQEVDVDGPDENEMYNHVFSGYIDGFRNGFVQVRDADDNVWDVDRDKVHPEM